MFQVWGKLDEALTSLLYQTGTEPLQQASGRIMRNVKPCFPKEEPSGWELRGEGCIVLCCSSLDRSPHLEELSGWEGRSNGLIPQTLAFLKEFL